MALEINAVCARCSHKVQVYSQQTLPDKWKRVGDYSFCDRCYTSFSNWFKEPLTKNMNKTSTEFLKEIGTVRPSRDNEDIQKTVSFDPDDING